MFRSRSYSHGSPCAAAIGYKIPDQRAAAKSNAQNSHAKVVQRPRKS